MAKGMIITEIQEPGRSGPPSKNLYQVLRWGLLFLQVLDEGTS